MATVNQPGSSHRSGFTEWRATRPFWGGLLLILASLLIAWVPLQFALELLFIGGAFTVIGLVFAVIVFLIGTFALLRPDLSTILGITGIAFSVLSLIGALGGLLFGTLLGVAGGALCVAWQPPGTSERRETAEETASVSGGRQFDWQQEQFGWQQDVQAESTETTDTDEETFVPEEEEKTVSDTGTDEESTFQWEGKESETVENDTGTSPYGSVESTDEDPTFSWEEDPYAEGNDET